MNEFEFEIFTVRDVIAIYRRWYKLAICTFLGLVIPASVVIFLILPLYEATSSIWVNRQSPQTDYSVDSGNHSPTTTFRNLDREEEIDTYAEMIKARIIVETMVDQLDLTMEKLNRIRDARRYVQAVINGVLDGFRYIYNECKYLTGLSPRPSLEEKAFFKRVRLIDEAVERINVDSLTKSNVLAVSFRSSDPFLAKEAVNVIVDEFVKFYGNMKEVRAKEFFSEVAILKGDELEKAEKELFNLKLETSGYSIEQQQGLLLNQLSEAEEGIRFIVISKALLSGKISLFKERLSTEPKKILAKEIMKQTPTGRIKEGMTWELNPVYQKLKSQLLKSEVELNGLVQQEIVAKKMLDDYRLRLADLGQVDLKIKKVERKVKRLEDAYNLSIRNREEARITEEMSLARLSMVSVVGYAPFPLKPIRPRKRFYLIIALGASLIVSLAMPFLAFFNDSTIADERDVQNHLGIDFVVTFPTLKHNGKC